MKNQEEFLEEIEPKQIQTSNTIGDLESGPLEKTAEKEKTEETYDSGIPIHIEPSKIVLIGSPNFTWVPSMIDFRRYYIWDTAFVPSVISWTGIVFFTIATIAYIPGVADMTDINTYYYLALLPTFLGGFFFLVAVIMQTTITQRKWSSLHQIDFVGT